MSSSHKVTVDRIISKTWKLADREGYQIIRIRKAVHQKERSKLKELIREARGKKIQRSDEEKSKLY